MSKLDRLYAGLWIATVVAPIGLCISIFNYYSDTQFMRTATQVEGQVKSFQRVSMGKGKGRYEYEVAFKLPNSAQTYLKKFVVASARIQGEPPKSVVTVVTSATDPKKSKLIYESPDEEPIVMMAFFTIFAPIALYFCRRYRRRGLDKSAPNPA